MNTRRRFITILPLAGVSLLAACGKKAAETAPAAAPAPDPAPAAAPAPSPAPAPAAEPTPAAAPAATPAPTATGATLDPADPAAVALGYVSDASTSKSDKRVAGAICGNCALYTGKAGDTSGPCGIFPGKQVMAAGWCTAYSKKA